MKTIRFLLLALVLLLTGIPAEAQQDNGQAAGRIVPEAQNQIKLSFAPLVKKVAPAVVNVYSKRMVTQAVSPFMNDPFFQQFFGMGAAPGGLSRRMVQNALGSGVIVDKDGLVVTNAHVVEDADEINVVLTDQREFSAEKVIVDKASDIAVLRIKTNGAALPYVTLEPSEKLEVGDLVLAIGNPFGVGQTVTSGIVSALARSSLDINDFNFFIQTDAAINPGNSGGPLVAMDGGVVGINSAIFSRSGGNIGLGFAVPSEMVAAVLAAVKSGQKGERIVRPWLGIATQKVTPDIAQSLGFATPHGLLIAGLNSASPLSSAGIGVGDVIVAMDGHPLNDPAEMKFRMATIPIGGTAKFDITRKGGQKQTVSVKAMAPPETPPRHETKLEGTNPLAGATVANINPAVAVELGITHENGVIVMKVDPQSQAAQLVEPGDIILGVNDTLTGMVQNLQTALNNDSGGWVLTLESNGRRRQVIVR